MASHLKICPTCKSEKIQDEYFKNGVELSKCLVNLLNKGLKGNFVLPY